MIHKSFRIFFFVPPLILLASSLSVKAGVDLIKIARFIITSLIHGGGLGMRLAITRDESCT